MGWATKLQEPTCLCLPGIEITDKTVLSADFCMGSRDPAVLMLAYGSSDGNLQESALCLPRGFWWPGMVAGDFTHRAILPILFSTSVSALVGCDDSHAGGHAVFASLICFMPLLTQ